MQPTVMIKSLGETRPSCSLGTPGVVGSDMLWTMTVSWGKKLQPTEAETHCRDLVFRMKWCWEGWSREDGLVSDEGSCGTGASAEGLREERSSESLYTSCAAVRFGTNRRRKGLVQGMRIVHHNPMPSDVLTPIVIV